MTFVDVNGANPWDFGPYAGNSAYYYAMQGQDGMSPGQETIMDPFGGGWNPARAGGYGVNGEGVLSDASYTGRGYTTMIVQQYSNWYHEYGDHSLEKKSKTQWTVTTFHNERVAGEGRRKGKLFGGSSSSTFTPKVYQNEKINLALTNSGVRIIEGIKDARQRMNGDRDSYIAFGDFIDLNTKFGGTGNKYFDAQFEGYGNVTSGFRNAWHHSLYFIIPFPQETDGYHTPIRNIIRSMSLYVKNLTSPLVPGIRIGQMYEITIRIGGSHADAIISLRAKYLGPDSMNRNYEDMKALFNYMDGN